MNAAAPRKVAFQGEAGAFSEEAALDYFGADVETLACRDFRAVGDAVASGVAALGLLPVENSLAGSVVGSYDVLADLDLAVVGEVTKPIRMCVMCLPGGSLQTIKRVVSHPVALAQCTRFLEQHPSIDAVAFYDTAGAAKHVASAGDTTLAAIAAKGAAARYGLTLLAEDIQDRADNQTRFFAVTRRDAQPPEANVESDTPYKTVLLARTSNNPGGLVNLLLPFAQRGVNLTKLESRPDTEPWTYRFFMELSGAAESEPVAEAIRDALKTAPQVRVLGSFPCSATS
jgi:prephenate dehydratase